MSDAEKARMVMLKGLNWDADDIANEVGVGTSTVYTILNDFEDQSKRDGVDPKRLFWRVVLADVFDGDLREAFAQLL